MPLLTSPRLQWLRRLMFWLEAERAHHWAITYFRWHSRWLEKSGAMIKRPSSVTLHEARGFEALAFANRVGIAAGFDKGEVIAPALFAVGFGFVEIGTVTPRPQAGNPKPRLFRLPSEGALINRMGFNNPGAECVGARLAHLRCKLGDHLGPIWLNIGKNRDTPNERAHEDYTAVMSQLYPLVDAFVLNISSPNTPQLRDLQAPAALSDLLAHITRHQSALAVRHGPRPLLVKLSPDMSEEALSDAAAVINSHAVQGVILTNTTLERPLINPQTTPAGGLSGRPLKTLSERALTLMKPLLRSDILIVSTGGISSFEEGAARLAAGAQLIQIYTAFVYQGPRLVNELATLK